MYYSHDVLTACLITLLVQQEKKTNEKQKIMFLLCLTKIHHEENTAIV